MRIPPFRDPPFKGAGHFWNAALENHSRLCYLMQNDLHVNCASLENVCFDTGYGLSGPLRPIMIKQPSRGVCFSLPFVSRWRNLHGAAHTTGFPARFSSSRWDAEPYKLLFLGLVVTILRKYPLAQA